MKCQNLLQARGRHTNAALALSSTALSTAQDESEEQITTKAKILLIQISLLKKGGK